MAIPVPGRLAESIRQSVVQVRGDQRSSGSGFMVGPGLVVTNAHVLRGRDIRLETWEGATLAATATRINRSRDLALLTAAGLQAKALPFGDSQGVQPGLPVFAIGNPLGFVGAVSSGVIHRVNLRRWICADVQLAPGNSGGPLVTYSGQIIGVNTMVVAGGLALAIPSRAVEKFLKQDDTRSLGVSVRTVIFRDRRAVLITGITPQSAAERASLLPGDILTGANDATFTHADDLSDAIHGAKDGLLHLEFYRGDGRTARRVTADLAVPEGRAAGVRTAA